MFRKPVMPEVQQYQQMAQHLPIGRPVRPSDARPARSHGTTTAPPLPVPHEGGGAVVVVPGGNVVFVRPGAGGRVPFTPAPRHSTDTRQTCEIFGPRSTVMITTARFSWHGQTIVLPVTPIHL